MASSGTIREVKTGQALRISVEDLSQQMAILETELKAGRVVDLMRGEMVIAQMRAPTQEAGATFRKQPSKVPDFMGRMRAIWGDKVFPEGTGTRWVRKDRDARG